MLAKRRIARLPRDACPWPHGPDGRDHNTAAYPMLHAGAGVKKRFTCGATLFVIPGLPPK